MVRRRPSWSDASLGALRRALCVLALAVIPLWAAAATPNYRLEVDAPDEIVDALRAQTLVGRWIDDPGFDAAQLPLFVDRARSEAAAIAQAAGFFSARVDVTTAAAPDGLPLVRLSVVPGARATVGRLELRIEGVDARTGAALTEAWPLPEGSFFRTGEWELGKRQLIEQLHQRGHLRARVVESLARVDVEITAAELALHVDAGPRLSFGPMTVRGLERYPRAIVDDLRPFREGEPYAFDTLLAFQDRLRAQRWFSSASVLPDLAAVEADPGATRIPVIVELRERRRQGAGVGVGFSTDNGPRALATYEHRDLLGRGWVLESGALIESVRHRAHASVSTPWDATGRRWQSGLRTERLDVSGQLTDKRTLYFGQGRRHGDAETFLSLQYQSERAAIDAAANDALTSRSAALTLGYAWLLRRVDALVDPARGYTVSAQLSGGARGLGADRSFLRAYGRAMRFWTVPSDAALAGGRLIALAELGFVVSDGRDGIPSDNLFRAGGAQSIRGFDYLGLGVRVGDAVVGGRVLALGSLEYQHPLTGPWYGAVFLDVGNAADRWADWRAVRGSGVGLRWRSPVGPVNLDLAHGSTDGRWRLHFSVGYSF